MALAAHPVASLRLEPAFSQRAPGFQLSNVGAKRDVAATHGLSRHGVESCGPAVVPEY